MQIIVSGILFVGLAGCGQVHEQYEPKSMAEVTRIARIAKSMPAFIQRVAVNSKAAPPNVVNAIKESMLSDNHYELIAIIGKKRAAPKALKRGTSYLVDPYLQDEVASTVRAEGKVAYVSAMDLLDEMVRLLSIELPPELHHYDTISVRNRALELKKELYWLFPNFAKS